MDRTIPRVEEGRLYQSETDHDPIVAGTPAWYDWLEQHTAFTFVDAAGLSGDVTLVSAPAGFGKTTLLAQWLSTIDRPIVWLSLDEHDNDPRVFVRSLAAALQRAFSDAFQGTASLLESPRFPSIDQV